MDPHYFFADPDPAVFLNADPDPGGKINADPCKSVTSFKKSPTLKQCFSETTDCTTKINVIKILK